MPKQSQNVPVLITQPSAFTFDGSMMAAVVISPYGGAAQDVIERFPKYASLSPLTTEAPMTGPWNFWQADSGSVVLALNKPGEEGAVHVIMEIDPPEPWWKWARERAQLAVIWLPDARHPTGEEILDALNSGSGWIASARWVPPVELL